MRISESEQKWFYFGCDHGAGHYLFDDKMKQLWGAEYNKLRKLDGLLTPQDNTQPYVAAFSRLDGWGVCAIAFWDYSVDTRSGSNSIIFVNDLSISPEGMFDEAKKRFPHVFNRVPKQVTLCAATVGNPTRAYEQYGDPERD